MPRALPASGPSCCSSLISGSNTAGATSEMTLLLCLCPHSRAARATKQQGLVVAKEKVSRERCTWS